MIAAYRITKTKFSESAFTGEGAKLYGGRWNEQGIKMVYLASSRSLATLELLVHIEDRTLVEGFYSMAEVRFDDSLISKLSPPELPSDWDSAETGYATQKLGSDWVRNRNSVILQVPSVVTAGEVNYLLNPDHPDFEKIEIGEMKPYKLDARLM